jgi:MoaA/NifB/PqqE/SkfB family radical SAM enzyme
MDMTAATLPVLAELLHSNLSVQLSGQDEIKSAGSCPFVERGSLSIRWDGKASPCLPLLHTHHAFLGERQRVLHAYACGDIQQQSLMEIWQAPAYAALRQRLQIFDFSPCVFCNTCDLSEQNLEDCFGSEAPACGGCLWAQGLIRCP